VSGIASTPYDTAVGGTDLNWCNQLTEFNGTVCPAAPYWNTTNNSTTISSAAGYVPEVPWNDTCASPQLLTTLEALAKQVSYSGVTDAESACNFVENEWLFFAQQDGVDLASLIDTIGGGGGASGCVVNDGQNVSSCLSSTTSTGAANGSIPLVNDGWPKPSWQAGVTGIPSDGVRDIPDVSFFAGNGFLGSATLVCISANGACVSATDSGFPNLTTEPVVQEIGGTSVGTPQMAGVMALINQKTGAAQGNPNAQLYKLAGKQTYSSCSSESVTAGSTTCYFNDVDTGTIDMPCDWGAPEGGLIIGPGGQLEQGNTFPGIDSPNCTTLHSGDTIGLLTTNGTTDGYNAAVGFDLATGLGSLNVANVVNGFVSQVGAGAAKVTVSPASGSITANQSLNVVVTVASSPAGGTTPSGTVTLSGGGYTSAAQSLSSGTYTFAIPGDSLSAGTDTLTVSYSGDSNYATATGTATVTVTKLPAVVTVTPSSAAINSNAPLTVTGTVTGTGGTPTGTVTLSGGGYTSAALALSNGSYSVTIPANTFTASGTVHLSAVYSGDSTYLSESGSGTVTVTLIVVLTPTVAATASPNPVDSNATLSVTATVTGTGPTPTGTVVLSGGGLNPTLTGTLSGGVYVFSVPASSLSTATGTLTVTYSGDGNYSQGAPATVSFAVAQSAFTLKASTAATIASPGGTSTSTITVTAANGYSGTVTLTCSLTSEVNSGDIDPPTCSIPTTAVAVGGTATATVSTTSASAELVYPKMGGRGRGWAGAGGGAVLALLLFFGIPARRRSWRTMVGMLVLMVTLGGLAGCGGGGGGTTTQTGTTPDTYTFTVTGTGSPAVSPVPTTTFAVTVN
jgi:hypothetical protein